MSGRGRKAPYHVTENVTWLTFRAGNRDFGRLEALTALQRSVHQLVGEIERSGKLKADIAAGIEVRRYELYRRSVSAGSQASSRSLAAAQRVHVGSVLKYIHAIASTCPDRHEGDRPSAPLDPLAGSIRELEASLRHAQRLSREMLTQCRRPDWRDRMAPLGEPRAGPPRL